LISHFNTKFSEIVDCYHLTRDETTMAVLKYVTNT